MTPECAATIFHVKNVDASIAYYTTVVGFTLDFRYNDIAGLEYGPVLIYLSGPAQDVKKEIGGGTMYIFCDEIDAYYEEIVAKGAIISVPIDDRQYGMRDFAMQDIDGNIITFGKSI